jgi:light-regulated signal transduction histidine kinase (bacteriophytochrome)
MQELERSNAELKDFASIASHDLQEPLRKVIAFGEHLKDHSGDKLDDLGLDFLARMQNAAQRMAVLIEALLQYSRVAMRARPFQAVDMLAVAFGVVADMEERIAQSQARIEFVAMPKVMADPMQMRQLMQNLVGNALKFQRPDTQPHVVIEGRTTDHGWCEISVRDNGIGFDEKYVERIFRPFQRLHGRSEYQGSGMGLAICRKVVARHGGTITAHSKPGEGSTFAVTLPAAPEVQPERRDPWEIEKTASSSESCSPKMMTTIST